MTVKKNILDLNQENEQLKAKISGLSDTNVKLGEYDTKLHIVSQQLESVNLTIEHKNNQINSLSIELQESRNKNLISLQEN